MTDSLGYRRKYAVLIPSTNTSVQPEFDAMRPPGVTNHISRIRIPNIPLENNDDFNRLIELITAAQDEAVDAVMSCEPDHLVLGISAETFWDGLAASRKLRTYLEQKTGLPVTMGSDACSLALDAYGARTIGIVTPYQPVGDENVVRFFEECGYKVKHIRGLRCQSPVQIAHVQPGMLEEALYAVDDDGVDALVQVGTNLAMAALAGAVESKLHKPVLAINTAIYWQALRSAGINDKVSGFGSLLERF